MLNIEKGEGLLVSVTLLQAFCSGVALLLTPIIASAMFLEHYAPDNLPFIFLASSVLVPVIGYLQLTLSKRMSFLRMQYLTLALLMVASGLFLLSFKLFHTGITGAALFVWLDVEFSLWSVVFWGMANRMFSVRQGKRLFGLITTGQTAAIILGGFATPFLISVMGTANLLVFAFAAHAIGIINLVYMGRRFRSHFEEAPTTTTQATGSTTTNPTTVSKQKYTLVIYGYFALMAYVCYYFVDTLFLYEVNKQYSSADELAAFIGQFWAYYGIAAFVLQLTVGGRWMGWFGIRGSLLTTPVILGIISLLTLVVGNTPGMMFLVFPIVVGLRLLSSVFGQIVGFPVYNILFQPLAADKKAVAQATAETMVGPLCGGITGIFLLILTKGFDLTAVGLAGVMIPVAGVWIAIGWLASRGYRQEIESALTRRGFDHTAINLKDPYCIEVIDKGLSSAHTAEVLYCLDLAAGVEHPRLEEHLVSLATHADPEVRKGVYAEFETRGQEANYPFLAALLENEGDPAAREALLRAVAASGEAAAFELLAASLESEDRRIRRGALVGLIRYGGIEGAVSAGGKLLGLEQSVARNDRIFAAEVLGAVGIASFYRGLIALFDDPDQGVRRAAIQAAGKLNNPRLLPWVVQGLADAETRDAARNVLLEAGATALPQLESSLATIAPGRPEAHEILRILGGLGTPAVIPLLLRQLTSDNRLFRGEALWSLLASGFRVSRQAEEAIIRGILAGENDYSARIGSILQDMPDGAAFELVQSALQHELYKTRERSMILLALLYSPATVMTAWHAYRQGGDGQRDMALELLENTLSKADAGFMLTLLTHIVKQGGSTEDAVRHIDTLFNEAESWDNRWLLATAVDATRNVTGQRPEPAHPAAHPPHKQPLPLLVDAMAWTAYADQPSVAGKTAVLDCVRLLRHTEIFNRVPDELLAHLAERIDERTLAGGEPLFAQGEPGSSMFLIITGAIRVHADGQTIAILGNAEIIGELAALDPGPRTAAAMAESSCHLFEISHAVLFELLKTQVEVAMGIIQVLCGRISGMIQTGKGERNTAEPVGAADDKWVGGRAGGRIGEALTTLEKVIVLKTAPVFAAIPDNILFDLANRTWEETLNQGETLFEAGDCGTAMSIIVAGKLRVHHGGKTLAMLGARTIVGEMAALSSEPRSATITTEAPTHLLTLDQLHLLEVIRYRPEIAVEIVHVLVRRLRSLL